MLMLPQSRTCSGCAVAVATAAVVCLCLLVYITLQKPLSSNLTIVTEALGSSPRNVSSYLTINTEALGSSPRNVSSTRTINTEALVSSPRNVSSTRTAICFVGQFRSFLKTVSSAKRMVSTFPQADVFMFINLQSSGKGGHWAYTQKDLAKVSVALVPVSIQTYTQLDFDAAASILKFTRGETCWQHERHGKPCCSWTFHGTQFWTIQRCFTMVRAYEDKYNFSYNFVVRARPDTSFPLKLLHAIRERITINPDGARKQAWLRKGAGSDAFAVLTEGAADAYGNAFNYFGRDKCLALPPMLPNNGKHVCKDAGVSGIATECLLYQSMVANGVSVTFDRRFNVGIVRP